MADKNNGQTFGERYNVDAEIAKSVDVSSLNGRQIAITAIEEDIGNNNQVFYRFEATLYPTQERITFTANGKSQMGMQASWYFADDDGKLPMLTQVVQRGKYYKFA